LVRSLADDRHNLWIAYRGKLVHDGVESGARRGAMKPEDGPVIVALGIVAAAVFFLALVQTFGASASGEFWAAIAGAVVGGLIALGGQLLALREA